MKKQRMERKGLTTDGTDCTDGDNAECSSHNTWRGLTQMKIFPTGGNGGEKLCSLGVLLFKSAFRICVNLRDLRANGFVAFVCPCGNCFPGAARMEISRSVKSVKSVVKASPI
jgi:hypothetical protein